MKPRLVSVAVVVAAVAATWIAVGIAGGRAALPRCPISQLRLKLTEPVTEKTEQHTTAVSVRNVSSRSCALLGYPTLALLDRRGHELPFSYRYQGDQMITAARPRLVRLAERGSAFFAFNKNVCVSRATGYAQTLRVALPASRSRRAVTLGPRAVDYCGRHDPGHVITVSPLVLRFFAAFCVSQGPCRRG